MRAAFRMFRQRAQAEWLEVKSAIHGLRERLNSHPALPAAFRRPPRASDVPCAILTVLLFVEAVLYLYDQHRASEYCEGFLPPRGKGWPVLDALACDAVAVACFALWLPVAALFRLRSQFTIRFLLVFVLAAALPCCWFASAPESKRAKRRRREDQAAGRRCRVRLPGHRLRD